jgi:hypothetical protein
MKRTLFPFAFLAISTAAYAQDAVVEGSGRDTGVTFGGGVGVGHITCEGADCGGVNTAGGLMLHVGGMLNPSVALLGDAWGMLHREDRATFSQGMLMGAVRWWPIQRFWIGGGVGIAVAEWKYDADVVELTNRSAVVPAGMLNAGIELISSRSFSLDVELRGGTGFYDHNDVQIRNVMLGVAVNFF